MNYESVVTGDAYQHSEFSVVIIYVHLFKTLFLVPVASSVSH